MNLTFLSVIRLIMFILINYIYYSSIQEPSVVQLGFILVAIIGFIVNHLFLMTDYGERKYPLFIGIDFVLTAGYSFLFPQMNVYLILFGVIAVTLFLMAENKIHLWTFSISFVLVWISNIILHFQMTGDIPIMSNLINTAFVVFGATVGRLIHKLISAQEKIEHQYDQLNQSHDALKDAHEQLHIFSSQVEELTLTQERNRISREIHDTVGHKMTALLVQLQVARELREVDPEKSKETIQLCEELARNALQEIRLSVQTLQDHEGQHRPFVTTTRELLEDYQEMTGLKSNLHIKGEPSIIPPTIQLSLTRIIQESITNAVRHGKATECDVAIEVNQSMAKVIIRDNGVGSSVVNPGFGLSNMRERVYEYGGTITFEGNNGKGFEVIASFPMHEVEWKVGDAT